ncbi:MAG: class I SAM-dependent methyltransferase [Patescibacteria group bacterium]
MDGTQLIQEEEYSFPYHHLPTISPFSQTRSLWWGYEYAAYIEYILSELSSRSFQSLIDIGCGDGRLLADLSGTTSAKLHGTDFSEKALAFARAFSPKRVTFSENPPDEKFDVFTAIEVFEHIHPNDADAFLASCAETLSTNGVGIISVPTTNIPLNPKHYRHFTENTFREALEKHFIVERVVHLNGQTLVAKIVQRLLANRFFILNWQPAKDFLYRWYTRTSLFGTPTNDIRVLAVVSKQ